jgi:hypothetical protein
MAPIDPETGMPMLDFPNSPGMHREQQKRDDAEAESRAAQAQHQMEMRNITEEGPLDRLNEEVVSEEEAALAKDVDTLADRITEEFKSLGASEEDLGVIKYFKNIAVETQDKALKQWGVDMLKWVQQLKKVKKR